MPRGHQWSDLSADPGHRSTRRLGSTALQFEAFLCLGILPHLLGLICLARRSPGLPRTLIQTALVLGIAATLFWGLPAWTAGKPASGGSWSAAANNLAASSFGWILLILPILVILAPLWAAPRMRQR